MNKEEKVSKLFDNHFSHKSADLLVKIGSPIKILFYLN